MRAEGALEELPERTRDQVVRYGVIVLVAVLLVFLLAMAGSAKFHGRDRSIVPSSSSAPESP